MPENQEIAAHWADYHFYHFSRQGPLETARKHYALQVPPALLE
jgi:hypothetical protein